MIIFLDKNGNEYNGEVLAYNSHKKINLNEVKEFVLDNFFQSPSIHMEFDDEIYGYYDLDINDFKSNFEELVNFAKNKNEIENILKKLEFYPCNSKGGWLDSIGKVFLSDEFIKEFIPYFIEKIYEDMVENCGNFSLKVDEIKKFLTKQSEFINDMYYLRQ